MKKLITLFLILAVSAFAQAANTATVGQTVTLTASADGTVPFTYQWYKDGNKWVGMTSAVVTFSSVQLYDAGTYKCVITNSAGSATTPDLQFTVGPVILPPTNPKSTFSAK